MKKPIWLSIQWLILGLLAFAMLGTFAGSVISSVVVSKNNLEKNYLIENQYYAQKLAATTDSLFEDMIKNLTTESQNINYLTNDSRKIHKELEFILQSTTYFNSAFFADKTGRIVASAPDMALDGTRLNSVGAKKSLEKKVPIISKPYVGVTGKLIMLISVPVFDDNRSYKGFLAGSIYLQEENSLTKVLGQHPKHENDSYVYVIDSEGNIIYHPVKDRINDNVTENKVVKQVLEGKNGNLEVTNTKGISMLAGYASAT
ncbi:cache domain-containing protein [Cytobacillus sp. FSL H8-0458]|uniref:cache domain-containing protein n=1 Tax=Cytobacillus sp. FSL H8-0458 TaxID=2975346 RepID=UPI0030FAAE66